jgi:hypothetical protein
MIQRSFVAKLGYDCRKVCLHERKGDHGIHCTEWVYTVVDHDARIALELEVYTPFYPESVEPTRFLHNIIDQKPFRGSFLRWHFGYATNRAQILAGPASEHCALIGRCWAGGSGLDAEPLVNQHFERNVEDGWARSSNQLSEQPALWAALEQRLETICETFSAERKVDGDLKWQVCAACAGTGTCEIEDK